MTRILGLDPGEVRIGVAIAEGAGAPARPLITIRRGQTPEADSAAIGRLVREHRIDELVVGLALDMGGDEGPQAQRGREWGAALASALPVPVTFRDERLTSHEAERRLGPMPRGRSGGPPTRTQRDAYRARVDREAAAIILQDELDARSSTRPDRSDPSDPPTPMEASRP